MEIPTIVRQTKNYILVKIPLPAGEALRSLQKKDNGKMTAAEKRLWGIIQEGEKEYRERKTVSARSSEEALRIYERKNKKD